MQRIVALPFAEWSPDVGATGARRMTADLESGQVLFLPGLEFTPTRREYRFFDPCWLGRRQMTICLDPARGAAALAGATGQPQDLAELAAMLARFRAGALALTGALFPGYKPWLNAAATTFRPLEVATHKPPRREDDSLLHLDACPSRPRRGERILRVYCNVNPAGVPRVWKLGGSFEATAREFAPRVGGPLPGLSPLLHALGLTDARRSHYDHLMLGMHDAMKEDREYQTSPGHEEFSFPDGSTWICFPDQRPHAAVAGQFQLEQTIFLPLQALGQPEQAPLRVLERMFGRTLA